MIYLWVRREFHIPCKVLRRGGMCFPIAVRAETRGPLKPQASMRSSWSWSNLVRLGPTAAANCPTHWKIGSSEGAFFFLICVLLDVHIKSELKTYPRPCKPCLICIMISSRNGFISLPIAVAVCPIAVKAKHCAVLILVHVCVELAYQNSVHWVCQIESRGVP